METIPESSTRPQPQNSADLRSKEQRRRERRERRAARRQQQQNFAHFRGDPFTIYGSVYGNMPDILNSHMPPPPYSTLPHSSRSSRSQQPQNTANNSAVRSATARARRWRPLPPFTSAATTDLQRSQFLEESVDPKSCCGVTVTQTVSIRWFIVMIAFVGICCSIVGTVLGAMKASGREHLTVSLLMIGVGIVLITVSGIAWRLTATDAPSCRAMLGLSGSCEEDYNNGRFLSRPQVTNNCGTTPNVSTTANSRPQHPYAAMMYSDFPYRPPPPSYQASMQEYRLRLLLLDRQASSGNPANQNQSNPVTEPPPNYRAHLRNAMMQAMSHSRPPSYRSHISDHAVIETGGNTVTQPLTAGSSAVGNIETPSSSSQSATEVVQVAQVHQAPVDHPVHRVENNQRSSSCSRPEGQGQDVSIVQVSDSQSKNDLEFKYDMDTSPIYEQLNEKKKKSVVTVVQTNNAEHQPVIVTVSSSSLSHDHQSGSSESGSDFSEIRASPAEVEILATL